MFFILPYKCTLAIFNVISGTGAADLYTDADLQASGFAFAGNPNSGEIWISHTGASGRAAVLLDLLTATPVTSFLASAFPSPTNMMTYPSGIDSVDGSGYFVNRNTKSIYKFNRDGSNVFFTPSFDGSENQLFPDPNGDMWGIAAISGSKTVIRLSNINTIVHTCTETVVTGLGATPNVGRFARNALFIAGRLYITSGTNGISWIDTTTLAGTNIIAAGQAEKFLIGLDGNIYSNVGATLNKWDQDGNFITSMTVTAMAVIGIYDSLGYIWQPGQLGGVPTFYKVSAADMAIVDSVPAAAGGITYLVTLSEGFTGVPVVHTTLNFGHVGLIYCV